ncbi:hypothetical protein DFH08DRAFT_862583 [Mycena albidolilacea]|uniref:Uncharacterized protein n=1 Tax=Mycena albidolilacea TaxID=1033008 RepID=A0AAD7A7X6_9AGAR|nr:hypothetical protein DFH08DRAFT_862583 [Mycena albidolilacea]
MAHFHRTVFPQTSATAQSANVGNSGTGRRPKPVGNNGPDTGGRTRFTGGLGGPGGESPATGGSGGDGHGHPLTIEEIDRFLTKSDVAGGIGGPGGKGAQQGGKGGTGHANVIVRPLWRHELPERLPHLSMARFCQDYYLSDKIRLLLEALGFATAGALFDVAENALADAGLKPGHIAEIKRALAQLVEKRV